MAGNIPKLVDKGFQNWIKANLALNITKEGIEDAVLTEINTFHQDTLNDILSPEQILNNDLCRQCKIENLLPCPTRGICIVKKGLCSFHYTQQKLFRPCPKHICDRLRDNIRRCHNFNFPSWKNTKAEYWCQNPWELAKCYLPPDGYLGVSSIAETDINGIVSVIMNLSAFKNKVNMHNCGQVREVTRTVRNSLDLCINDQDLNNILDTLVAFLSASLFHGDLKAATSVQNIAKLKMDSLTITTNFVTNILQDVTHENTKKSMQVMNEKQAERVHEINVDLDKLYEVAKVSAIDDIEGSRRTVIDDIKSTTVQLKTELNSDIDKVKTQAVAEIEEMKQTSIETEYQRLKTDIKSNLSPKEDVEVVVVVVVVVVVTVMVVLVVLVVVFPPQQLLLPPPLSLPLLQQPPLPLLPLPLPPLLLPPPLLPLPSLDGGNGSSGGGSCSGSSACGSSSYINTAASVI
ncbi:uncharacterized protein LOC128548139 [Mercenaria mercenaria]|uniref:uncharacterized protein LOC128548139 n=1 Tax=Mercenaria mercenaria TaxID=6596 RepID=UPI00234F472D|nr:uncharacterized protein LOC128548139 [Mercenaria mercenaria]